jgi:hypothetical protein
MHTVIDIVRELTPKALARRLGVRNTAISNAVAQNRFPARWYQIVTAMCSEKGIKVEGEEYRGLFNFIQNDDLDAECPQLPEVAQ